MNQEQLRLEVRIAAQNWVASMMQQYGVSAIIMEDALKSVQLNLKDLVTQEMISSVLAEKEAPIQEEEENENGGTEESDQ